MVCIVSAAISCYFFSFSFFFLSLSLLPNVFFHLPVESFSLLLRLMLGLSGGRSDTRDTAESGNSRSGERA